MDEKIAKNAAEHMFTRVMLSDLMVWQCMQADDPVAEVDHRSKYKLAAADGMLADKPEVFTHHYLVQLETFWQSVRYEVEARVRFRDQEAARQEAAQKPRDQD